jgi:hypothetical protein
LRWITEKGNPREKPSPNELWDSDADYRVWVKTEIVPLLESKSRLTVFGFAQQLTRPNSIQWYFEDWKPAYGTKRNLEKEGIVQWHDGDGKPILLTKEEYAQLAFANQDGHIFYADGTVEIKDKHGKAVLILKEGYDEFRRLGADERRIYLVEHAVNRQPLEQSTGRRQADN